jgi:hypothetical protein
MCVVAVKYIEGTGWIGAKNRDRNYSANIEIVQSNRNGIQRLYIDDKDTRWTEGLNEHGVTILSASFAVKNDEKEGSKVANIKKSHQSDNASYYSPDGLKVRNALKLKSPEAALKYLIENEFTGATFVFDDSVCFLLEGGYTADENGKPNRYIHKSIEITKKNDHAVRTNHGILIDGLGYIKNSKDDHIKISRKSSEVRYKLANKAIEGKFKTPKDLIDALSREISDDPFLNPRRHGDPNKGDMVTTGQLLVVPKERTLHYRPIFSSVSFKYDKINGPDSKTFFEIVTSKKLLSFKEFTSK